MSNVMAAGHLRDEIGKKLSQANGICTVICSMSDMANTPVSASLWAASELIDDAKKAVDALYEQASMSAEKAVQPFAPRPSPFQPKATIASAR